MPCLISDDGSFALCGGLRRRKYFFFARKYRHVLFQDSTWMEPTIVLTRDKHERVDFFMKRVEKKLGFAPAEFEDFWLKVLKPMLNRELRQERLLRKGKPK